MRTKKTWHQKVSDFLASKSFFYFVVGFLVLQSLWYAISFQGGQFDESFHFEFTRMYTEKISPFISSQDSYWDILGETTRYPSYLFHYLMSWPLRVIQLFTESSRVQIVTLRVISIAFFVAGLFLYRRLLLKIGASSAATNIILLFVTLTPNITLLAGTFNYDNLIFMLSGIVLLSAIRFIDSSKVEIVPLASIAIISLVASLVKFTFLIFFIPVLAYISIAVLKKYKRKSFSLLKKSFEELPRVSKFLVIFGLLISMGLVFERHGLNLIVHKDPKPSCQSIIDVERCTGNFVANRNIELLENKPDTFKPSTPLWYEGVWLDSIVFTLLKIVQSKPAPLIMGTLYVFALPLGIIAILLYARDIMKNQTHRMLLVTILIYSLTVMTYNYLLYVRYAQPIAMNGRYLLPIMPLFLFFVYLATRQWLSKYRSYAFAALLVILLCFTQGGGLGMHLIHTGTGAYWQNDKVVKINTKVKQGLHIVVLEKAFFNR